MARARSIGWSLLLSLQVGVCASSEGFAQTSSARPNEVVLDLAQAGPGPERVAVADVSRSVWLVVESLAPAARYTVTHDGPGGGYRGGLQHPGGYTRNAAFEHAPCGAVFSAIFDLAESLEPETRIPARVAKLRGTNAGDCPGTSPAEQAIKMLTRADVSVPVGAAEAVHVTVQRLSADGQVVRQWQVVLEGPTAHTRSGHASEQDWIVASVVREIAFALGGTGGAEVVTTSLPGTVPAASVRTEVPRHYEGTVTLAPYVWAPGAYARVVEGLLGRAPSARPGRSAAPAAQRLTDLRAVVIYDESAAALRALQEGPTDPAAQERAALVFAALAFRETAGRFSDPRLLLSRAAGRLAVARSLRGGGPPGLDGQVAEALLLVMAGRTAEAKTACTRLEGQAGAPAAAWARAIALRATSDWRALAHPETATLVERFEQLRALNEHRSASAAAAFLDSFKPEPVADWGRILLLNALPSVELCNRFAASLFQAELEEANTIRGRLLGQRLPGAKIVDDMDAAPGTPLRAGVPDTGVIEWGTWASFHERHAAAAAAAEYDALRHVLGLPKDADRSWANIGTTVARWRAFPFLSQLISLASGDQVDDAAVGRVEREQQQAPCAKLIEAISNEPQSVPAMLWYRAQQTCSKDTAAGRLPLAETWFGSRLLAGTAFDLRGRLGMGAVAKAAHAENGAGYAALHAIDPFAPVLVNYMVSGDPRLPLANRLKAYGSLAEYDLRVLSSIAQEAAKSAPVEALDIRRGMCSMDSEYCFGYGQALAELDRREEAAAVYRKALDEVRDRISASANAPWLIDYDFEQGRTDEALRLAESGAETYSGSGLLTLGETLERLGRHEEARQQFEAVRDRYGDDAALRRFYIRAYLLRKEARYEEQGKRALATYFPKGLIQVSMADVARPPSAGARVVQETPLSRQMGLAVGDEIVALNGYRVETTWQYVIVRSITDRTNLRLIVRRGSEYREVAALQKGYRMGLDLRP